MPPNKKGGKAYKKGKGGGEREIVFQDRTEGQVVARVVRALGNRNMLCFCQDNRLRICKLRGKIRHSEKIEVGDLVICSFRTYEVEETTDEEEDKKPGDASKDANTIVGQKSEAKPKRKLKQKIPEKLDSDARGDILAAYHRDQWKELKREPGMNQNLFLPIESMEGVNLSELGKDKAKAIAAQTDDCGFDIESGSDDEDDDAPPDDRPEELRGPARARGARQAAATAAAADDDDLNIDDI